MSKYSFEFKKQVVEAYLNGEGGYGEFAKEFHILAKSNVKKWIDKLPSIDDEGLLQSRKQESYSLEKKLSVVELHLSSAISYQDLALQESSCNPSQDIGIDHSTDTFLTGRKWHSTISLHPDLSAAGFSPPRNTRTSWHSKPENFLKNLENFYFLFRQVSITQSKKANPHMADWPVSARKNLLVKPLCMIFK